VTGPVRQSEPDFMITVGSQAVAKAIPRQRDTPMITIVIPAKNEAATIGQVTAKILSCVRSACEILVVVDAPEDPTRVVVQACAAHERRLRCLTGKYGQGPASAIRYGIDQARGDVIVVTMADDCDDPSQIDQLAALVRRGAVVAAASRYAPGGRQIGGPVLKGLLSRLAGRSLHLLARTGTTDATNSFKAYSAGFVREVGIDSRGGFEIGIELTAKARRLRRPVAEIPTVWRDRQAGQSGFRMLRWLPCYLRWYRLCFGRRLTVAELARRGPAGRP
jgi:glycosyltransferase involved in cell wall biosynthesis